MYIQIVERDLLNEAVAFAKSIQDKPFEYRRTGRKSVKDADKAQQFAQGNCLIQIQERFNQVLNLRFCLKSEIRLRFEV